MKIPKIPYVKLVSIPVLLIAAGVLSNQVVLISNGGKFPVLVNSRKLSKFMDKPCETHVFPFSLPAQYSKYIYLSAVQESCSVSLDQDGMIDDTHSRMGANSHIKALADIWDLGTVIYSIGDGLLMLGFWTLSFTPIMWLALILRKVIE